MELSFKIYSYRSTFNDGEGKLHLGFVYNATLYVLTTKLPRQNHIKIHGNQMQGPHISAKDCYLTIAYNQAALRFGNKPAGTLTVKINSLPRT